MTFQSKFFDFIKIQFHIFSFNIDFHIFTLPSSPKNRRNKGENQNSPVFLTHAQKCGYIIVGTYVLSMKLPACINSHYSWKINDFWKMPRGFHCFDVIVTFQNNHQ